MARQICTYFNQTLKSEMQPPRLSSIFLADLLHNTALKEKGETEVRATMRRFMCSATDLILQLPTFYSVPVSLDLSHYM